MIKYLAFDEGATTSIINDQYLQSIEFQQGAVFADLLTTQFDCVHNEFNINNVARCIKAKHGIYVIGSKRVNENLFVIDCEKTGLFGSFSKQDSLLILQRLLRFAVRHWKQLTFSGSERIIPNSNLAAVFPYSWAFKRTFRIAIDRDPFHGTKTSRTGKFLLAYKVSDDEGLGNKENPDTSNFGKAMQDYNSIVAFYGRQSNQRNDENSCQDELISSSVSLDTTFDTHMSLSFQNWLQKLTLNQKAFVLSPSSIPCKIEGPAGTGKTLCLILKAINIYHTAVMDDGIFNIVFIVHSEALKEQVVTQINIIHGNNIVSNDRRQSNVTLSVMTLQELSVQYLSDQISLTDILDEDAEESKIAQLLFIEDAVKYVMTTHYDVYKDIISDDFRIFLENESPETKYQMFRHEISVLIKGRCNDNFEIYRSTPSLKYGIPISKPEDKDFVFNIYKHYQSQLSDSSVFDVDDIVITLTSRFDTPVWRRRRINDGYDLILVDETHLFNMNELSVFHFLGKNDTKIPISFSFDSSQANGDRGWDSMGENAIINKFEESSKVNTIFRSSNSILNLAMSITSSGATLFTNFHNSLENSVSSFSESDESKSRKPCYVLSLNDSEMIKDVFKFAEKMKTQLSCSRSEIAIIVFDNILYHEFEKYCADNKRNTTFIKKRGDYALKQDAYRRNNFILSLPEYIGGLEFDGVIIAGADSERVPEKNNNESNMYLKYIAHNKLYTAITRAKYQVQIFGLKSCGLSELFKTAVENELIDQVEME